MKEHTHEPQPYSWMFKWRHQETYRIAEGHNAWLFKEVRENYEEQRETSATFKVRMISPDSDHGAQGDRATVTGMLAYLGSWRCPDRFTANHTNNWINHRAKWAPKFSDGAVVCPCGAIKYHTEGHTQGEGHDQNHTDDCTKINEHRTKMLMWQQRERILRQSALNGHLKKQAARRMDLTRSSIAGHCKKLNLDYDALKYHGLRKWRATMVKLQEDFGFSQGDLADVFGKSRSTLREHINGNLDAYQDDATSIEHGVIADD